MNINTTDSIRQSAHTGAQDAIAVIGQWAHAAEEAILAGAEHVGKEVESGLGHLIATAEKHIAEVNPLSVAARKENVPTPAPTPAPFMGA